MILRLLFELATWHGLAKLRLHTESTVQALENSTTRLGIILREFSSTTCAAFMTWELPSEQAARGRHKAAMAKKSASNGPTIDGSNGPGVLPAKKGHGGKLRTFNLSTYKIHSLGDYAKAICMFGTTDSYNTQVVSKSFLFQASLTGENKQGELEHRRVKRFYPRTQKGKFTLGITKQQRREQHLRKLKELSPNLRMNDSKKKSPPLDPRLSFEDHDPLLPTLPSQHYQMSSEQRHKLNLSQWLHENRDDPALKVSRPICIYLMS